MDVDDESPTDRLAHRLFLATLLAKGSLGVIQLAAAVAIHFRTTERLPALAQWLFGAELAEDPNDFLARHIMTLAGTVPKTDMTFYTVYFAAHGLLHVGVVSALLVDAMWAYPASVLVLAAFVLYQILEWIHVGGPMLLVLSLIDLAVIYLTLREWRHRRQSGNLSHPR